MAPKFLVKTGLDYGDTRREPGEEADDIPPESVWWLEEQGLIERIKDDVPAPATSPTESRALPGGES